MKIKLILNLTFFLLLSSNIAAQIINEPPAWAKDLIIYEIAPKGFTSPNGAESGTFNSLKDKMPYLKDLGINGIWLAGYSLSDPSHFYNTWTQYACIRPESFDPTLGNEADFIALIDEAHKNGIRVFLDVITHGLMNNSPLIKEHPDWFYSGSWGMTDFDWKGNHKDLDDWWINLWTYYVIKYGVDGFRLDVDIYRPDLWIRIKQNALNAGHPIVVWPEWHKFSYGASDFIQWQNPLFYHTDSDMLNPRQKLNSDATCFYTDLIKDLATFRVEIMYSDSTLYSEDTNSDDVKLISCPNLFSVEQTKAEKIKIQIKNIDTTKVIKSIKVFPTGEYKDMVWNFLSSNKWQIGLSGLSEIILNLQPFKHEDVFISITLSCHDNGWDGFPIDKNPYVAEGSRCVFGYSFLFLPNIPIFMSGEEFNADFVPLPDLSPNLFGGQNPGKGKWLYGSMIQWDQLKQKPKAEMLADVKRMIAIRKAESDIFNAASLYRLPKISAIEYKSNDDVPIPFILWNENKAIVVVGNNTANDVKLNLNVPLDIVGMGKVTHFMVTDLWNGTKTELKSADLKAFEVNIKKDRSARGGIGVFKIEPN
jgi:glycosidase